MGAASVLCLLVQLLGFMRAAGVGLSAVPAVILVLAAGMGAQTAAHVLTGFATGVGDKERRAALAVRHMSAPVLHAAATTFLGLACLATSEFDFIRRHFFMVLSALLALGLFDGLVFLPVLLSSVGPPAEVVPKGEDKDRVSLPPASPEPRHRYNTRSSSSRQKLHLSKPPPPHQNGATRSGSDFAPPRRHNSDASLSTIAEESHSYASSFHDPHPRHGGGGRNVGGHCYPAPSSTSSSFNGASVFVEPEVIVETTTLEGGQASRCSTPTQTTRYVNNPGLDFAF